MNKELVKDFVYGGLLEVVKNPRNFNYFGQMDYSKMTPDGIKSLESILPIIASMMLKAEHNELEVKAKELTLKALKDQNV